MIGFLIFLKIVLLVIPYYFGQAAYHQHNLLLAFESSRRLICNFEYITNQGGLGYQDIAVTLPDTWIGGRSYDITYKSGGISASGVTFSLHSRPGNFLLDRVKLEPNQATPIEHTVILPTSLIGNANKADIFIIGTLDAKSINFIDVPCRTSVVNPEIGHKLERERLINLILCIISLVIVLLFIIFIW